MRAGFSAVLAASVADNPSTLHGVHHIERGYHRPYEQFASLGLRLTRDDACTRTRGSLRVRSENSLKSFIPNGPWLRRCRPISDQNGAGVAGRIEPAVFG